MKFIKTMMKLKRKKKRKGVNLKEQERGVEAPSRLSIVLVYK